MKITLIATLTFLCSFNSQAQALYNTTWAVYYNSGAFDSFFIFGNDTLFRTVDNITFSDFSHYQLNADTMTIEDIDGGCLTADTGRYRYLVQNDTLKFILINDVCITRKDALTIFKWVLLPTAIDPNNSMSESKIFPNPFSEKLDVSIKGNALSEIILYDLPSRIILQQQFTNTVSLNTSQLAKGIYLYEIRNKNGVIKNGKLVKE